MLNILNKPQPKNNKISRFAVATILAPGRFENMGIVTKTIIRSLPRAARRGSDPGRCSGAPAPAIDFLGADPGFAELGALVEPLDRPRSSGPPSSRRASSAEGLGPYEARLDRIIGDLVAAATPAGAATDGGAAGTLDYRRRKPSSASSTSPCFGRIARTLPRSTGYSTPASYNCVSSAVLYMLAVRDLGIEVEGVRTSDHAFINVVIGGRSIDVETTNPYGFDPGGKKEFKDSFGRVTGFAYVAPGGYGDRKTISGRELVGLILSNRVAALERKGSFSEAARLGADYAALCPARIHGRSLWTA